MARAQRPDARELTRAFNATFGARAAEKTIRTKCATLGVRFLDGHRIGGPSGRSQRWYFNEEQEQWLRTHVGPASWESLSAEFAKSLGATPGLRSLRAKCAVLKIRKPHPRQLEPVTAEQIAWLRTHATGTERDALTRAFNERFEQRVGAHRISALAKTHGARTGKPAYPFGKREDEWIENACAVLDYDALTGAFNETFEARIARETIKYRCKKIGCRAIRDGTLHREYSAREVGWLRTNAATKDLDTLWKEFVATFREVGRYAIWHQCRIRGFEIRRGKGNSPFEWRESEERWLCANAPKATADELAQRFNEHFVAAMAVATVRAKCKALGAPCLERYHRYSEEEKVWIAQHTGQLPAGEAARRFNTRFATRVTPGAMYRACVKYGTKQVGPRRRRWDRNGLPEFVILYEAGRAVRAIGRTLKLTPKQCERAMEAAVPLGLIERRAKRRRWSDDEIVEVCANHDSDAGIEATAEKVAMSAREITSTLRVARTRGVDPRTHEPEREPTTKVAGGSPPCARG